MWCVVEVGFIMLVFIERDSCNLVYEVGNIMDMWFIFNFFGTLVV
jgi:hypothetical protein